MVLIKKLDFIPAFTPQHWFYIGSIVSGIALVGCVGYLGYTFIHGRHRRTTHYRARR